MQTLIEQEVNQFVDANKTITVNNDEDLGRATACIRGIKGLIDKVKQSFDPIVDQAHKAHKEAIGQRDKHLKPLQDMEKKFKDAILVFNKKIESEQTERIREANERLAKVAEENRLKLLQESQNTENEWDKQVLQEKAQEIQPITVDAPKKAIEQEGLSIRKTWKARVIDERIVPRSYLIVDIARINKEAKDELVRSFGISGIEFYEESSASVRS